MCASLVCLLVKAGEKQTKKRGKIKKKKKIWPEKCVLTYIYSNEVLNELMHIVQCVLYIYFNAKSAPDDSCFIFVLQGEWMKLSSIKLYIFWAQTKWASLNSYICVCVAVMLFSVSPILHHKHAFFPGYTRNERLTSSHFSDSYTQAGAHQFWQKSHIYFNIFNRFYPSVIMSVPSHQSPLQLHFFVCCCCFVQATSFIHKTRKAKSPVNDFHHNRQTFWPYKHPFFSFLLKQHSATVLDALL